MHGGGVAGLLGELYLVAVELAAPFLAVEFHGPGQLAVLQHAGPDVQQVGDAVDDHPLPGRMLRSSLADVDAQPAALGMGALREWAPFPPLSLLR